MAGQGYASGRKRRETIVEVARAHFAEHGYAAASLLAIAIDANISRSGLLHHFPSKKALLRAVLKDRNDSFREWIAPYLRRPGGLGALAAMMDLAAEDHPMQGQIELTTRLSSEASSTDHPARNEVSKDAALARRTIASTLRRASRCGYLVNDVDPDATAADLLAVTVGLRAMRLRDPAIEPPTHVRRLVVGLLTEPGRLALDESLD